MPQYKCFHMSCVGLCKQLHCVKPTVIINYNAYVEPVYVVVLLMDSWASEIALRIRYLLACLAGGREGLQNT